MNSSGIVAIALCAQIVIYLPSAPPEKLSGAGDRKVVCKTETPVGSLIPGSKRCHSLKQWEEHARSGQEIARRLMEAGNGMGIN